MPSDELRTGPVVDSPSTDGSERRSLRARAELDSLRERLACAQRLFEDYTATREARRRDADLAWARLSLDTSVGGSGVPSADTNAVTGREPHQPVNPRSGANHELQGLGESTAADSGGAEAPAPSRRAIGSRRRPFLLLLLLAVAASLAAVGMAHLRLRGISPGQQQTALAATAFEATIRPANQFTIAAPVTTVVQRVLVAVGDTVSSGQPLLVADDRDAKLVLDAAELELRGTETRIADLQRRIGVIDRLPVAALARATGRLSTAQREIEQVPTRQWRDSPERAEAAYDQARLRQERAKKLFDQGLVARQELDDAEIAVRIAANDLENARRAAAAGATVQSAQAEQSDLQWQVARAEQQQQREAYRAELSLARVRREEALHKVKTARDRLAAATITATAPGVVVELLAQPGDQVYGGAPLARIAVLDPLIAQVQVAATLVNALRPGHRALVSLPGIPVRHVEGTITAVNPIPSRNGNHTVDIRFDNPAGHLLSGQPAEVRFVFP